MASKKTLKAKNLEVLGAERLAEMLIEVSAGDAGVKRRIRLRKSRQAGRDLSCRLMHEPGLVGMACPSRRKDILRCSAERRRGSLGV
jgi:hypothetical protein